MAIPISLGGGAASIASEKVGDFDYQKIKIVGGETGSTSVMSVAPDGAILTSVIGRPTVVNPAGSVTAVLGTVTAPAGSVATVANLAGSVTAILGTVTAPAGSVMAVSFAASANQSVSGAVTAPPGSVMTVAALAGSVTGVRTDAASVITVWQNSSVITINASSSILAVPVGSVITVWQNSSVLTMNPAGSVTAVRFDTASLIGTYAEDVAHASADKGIFTLGVRNDLMASVTGADGDYSQTAVGPVGEVLTANAPIHKWVRGTTDHRVTLGASLIAIAAGGASVFTYITSAQIANMGSASVLVTIGGGLGSVLGYTIAPAGGGSNIVYPNALKTGENSAVTTSISGTSSVLVSLQGFTAKI